MALEYIGPVGTLYLQERISNPILLTKTKKGKTPPPLGILRGMGADHMSGLRDAFVGLITRFDYAQIIRSRDDTAADAILSVWIREYLHRNRWLGIMADDSSFIRYDNHAPEITTALALDGLSFGFNATGDGSFSVDMGDGSFSVAMGDGSFRVAITNNMNFDTSGVIIMPNQAQGLMCLLSIELFHSWPKRRRTYLTNKGTWPCGSFQEVTQKASDRKRVDVAPPFALIEALEALEPYNFEIIDDNKIVVQFVKHDVITTIYPTEYSELTSDSSDGPRVWRFVQYYEMGAAPNVSLDGSARAQHVIYSRTMLLHVLSMFFLGELADGAGMTYKLKALQKDLLEKIEGYTSTDPYRV